MTAGTDALWRRLGAHILAVLAPLAMLLVRQALPVSFGARPLLILFMPAILLPAMLGGLLPGLLATAASAAATAYFLVPPVGHFAIAQGHDLFQWGMLVLSGVMASLLAEFLHRARRREAAQRAELEATGTRLRATLDTALDGIIVIDALGRVVEFNPAAERCFGYRKSEALGRDLATLIIPERFRAAHVQGLERLRVGRDGAGMLGRRVEVTALRADGGEFPAELAIERAQVVGGELFVAYLRDISERKRAEAALLESSGKLESALGAMGDAVFISDNEGRFIHFNDAFATFHRFSSKDECARTFAEYPDILDVFLPNGGLAPVEMWAVPRALRGETATDQIYTLRRKDSGETWVGSYNLAPIRDQAGRIVGSVVTGRDVTAIMQSQAALLERDRMLSDMSTMAHIGGWSFDPASGQGNWTPECARIHDLPDDAPIDVAAGLGYYVGEHRQQIEAAVRAACEHGTPYDLEAEIISAAGRRKWIRTIGHPVVESGRVVKVFGAFQDITAYKQADADLRASELRFRRLFREAPLPLAYIDRNGVLVDRNQRFDQTFGYGHEVLHSLDDWWPLAYPDPVYRTWVLETWNAAVARAAAMGSDIEPIEYRVRCNSGDTRTLLISGIAIGEDFLATFFDVTERRQAEVALRELNANLEQRVAQRTAALSAANQELDAFAYAVSHDLRAPLRAMSGFAQALVEDYGAALNGDARTYLDQITVASGRMGELIDGILVLSRSTRGQMRHEAVDLSALARRLGDELARGEPGRAVVLEIEPGLSAQGDPRMLEVVLANLLGNAWKYTGNTSRPEIRMYAEERAGQRWFCIADNGAGFDMAHAERLFQPFQRLHRQDEFPGIGIGLATVQRIVHRHGGEIEARGEVGKGAIFRFRLASDGRVNGEP